MPPVGRASQCGKGGNSLVTPVPYDPVEPMTTSKLSRQACALLHRIMPAAPNPLQQKLARCNSWSIFTLTSRGSDYNFRQSGDGQDDGQMEGRVQAWTTMARSTCLR